MTATRDSSGVGPGDAALDGRIATTTRYRWHYTKPDILAETTDQRAGRATYGPQGGVTRGQTRPRESASNRRRGALIADLVRFPS